MPLIVTYPHCSRQPALDIHEILKNRLLDRLRDALPVDGVLLDLHGGYSVQGLDDGDGDILQAVRRLVGPDCLIMAVHDPHCNIGPLMVENPDALIIEDTFPHVDMAVRALEAADMMVRTIRGEIRPTMASRPIPMFWAAAKMISAEEPIKSAYQHCFDIEMRPGVLTASIGLGYQWADIPIVGASTIVVISEYCQPIDLAFSRSLGLDCRELKYICVKSTGHFRSGFGPIAGSIFNVDTASVTSQDFANLPFTRLGRKIYPIDRDAAFELP